MSVHERYREYQHDQREFFDALVTEDWDSYISEEWDESRRYEVSELFKRIQPATILDIGCGCGFHDKEVAKYSFVKKVTGIDYSKNSIEAANKHYPHDKVERITCDITELNSNGYDLVVSWQVFEHISEPELYFSKALNALKNDGWLVIFTPNRLRLSNVKRILTGKKVEYCDPQHFYEYVPREIKKIGNKYNLEFVEWFGYGASGFKIIDKLEKRKRLMLGGRISYFADLFCIIFKKKNL